MAPDNFDKVSTGIPGLDHVLMGGMLRNRIWLLRGEPGTGKTTIALQFLLSRAAAGDKCLMITLSESMSDLRSVADAHQWDLDPITICDLSTTEATLNADAQYTIFHPAEVELGETTRAIISEVDRVKPQFVVFDGLSEVRMLAREPMRYRRQMLALKQYFMSQDVTVLVLDDLSTPFSDIRPESIVTGVITLEQSTPIYGGARRRLYIQKIRGSNFVSGYHDYAILLNGVNVYPRLIPAEHVPAIAPASVPIRLPGLKEMLNGTLEMGTSTLMLGPSGIGKTTLSLQIVLDSVAAGKKAAIFAYDETISMLGIRARELDPEWDTLVENERVSVRQINPAEMSPGAFVSLIRHAVEERGVRVIVIDSLNGHINSMVEQPFPTAHLHELLMYMSQQGVLTLLIMAQHGLLGPDETPLDVSYLADTVLVLRYFEAAATLNRGIGVFKKRAGSHEHTLRQYKITKRGLEIGRPLAKLHGIMTGVAQYNEGSEQLSGD